MPDMIAEGHDARITRLGEDGRELRLSLKEMANTITDLAEEVKDREADRESYQETFRRIFAQLEANRDEFTRLWHCTYEMISKGADAEQKRLQDELEARVMCSERWQKRVSTFFGLISALHARQDLFQVKAVHFHVMAFGDMPVPIFGMAGRPDAGFGFGLHMGW